jgi:hypothetical protein
LSRDYLKKIDSSFLSSFLQILNPPVFLGNKNSEGPYGSSIGFAEGPEFIEGLKALSLWFDFAHPSALFRVTLNS